MGQKLYQSKQQQQTVLKISNFGIWTREFSVDLSIRLFFFPVLTLIKSKNQRKQKSKRKNHQKKQEELIELSETEFFKKKKKKNLILFNSISFSFRKFCSFFVVVVVDQEHHHHQRIKWVCLFGEKNQTKQNHQCPLAGK